MDRHLTLCAPRGEGYQGQSPWLVSISLVEPKVLVAVSVVDAVDHHGHPLHLRVTTRRLPGVEDDWPGAILRQPPFDFPHQLLALLFVGLGRLLVDQLVDLGTAIARVVALGRSIELLSGVFGHPQPADVLHRGLAPVTHQPLSAECCDPRYSHQM